MRTGRRRPRFGRIVTASAAAALTVGFVGACAGGSSPPAAPPASATASPEVTQAVAEYKAYARARSTR